MEPITCARTGLTRPECSCPSCVRRLIDELAPDSVRERLESRPAGAAEVELAPADHGLPPVIERLERPVL